MKICLFCTEPVEHLGPDISVCKLHLDKASYEQGKAAASTHLRAQLKEAREIIVGYEKEGRLLESYFEDDMQVVLHANDVRSMFPFNKRSEEWLEKAGK